MKCVRCEQEHDGKHKTCETCLGKVRVWNGANPERVLATKRRSQAKKYKTTVESFSHLLTDQGGVCGICQGKSKNMVKGKQAALHLDHNHATNKVRGFLCGQCNTALGKFMDDPSLLFSAVA